jgi:hypothetical protein
MSGSKAQEFLENWVSANVPDTPKPDRSTAERLANRCIEEAKAQGITKSELEAAAEEDLVDCIMDAQEATADDAKIDDLFE